MQVLLSGALTFGVPMLLAASELFRAPPRGRGGWDRKGPGQPPVVPPPSGGGEQTRPLPDCLLRAARGLPPMHEERVRELA
jgi:hypothetical protein